MQGLGFIGLRAELRRCHSLPLPAHGRLGDWLRAVRAASRLGSHRNRQRALPHRGHLSSAWPAVEHVVRHYPTAVVGTEPLGPGCCGGGAAPPEHGSRGSTGPRAAPAGHAGHDRFCCCTREGPRPSGIGLLQYCKGPSGIGLQQYCKGGPSGIGLLQYCMGPLQ